MEEYLKERKRELLNWFVKNGLIKSEAVLKAFEKVPREDFVLPEYRLYAYDDRPLPTLRGQTISAPHMAIILLEALELRPGHKVLEIGTGTGYQAALMSEIVGPDGLVVTIERIKPLAEIARKNLSRYKNVIVIWDDGLRGYPKYAPYDRILIATSVDEVPKALIDQLKPGGILVAPIAEDFRNEWLTVIKKDLSGRISRKRLMPVAFVRAKRGKEE